MFEKGLAQLKQAWLVLWQPAAYVEACLAQLLAPTEAGLLPEPLPFTTATARLPMEGRATRRLGQGLEFDRLQPYQPGDDVRALDWNVLARTLTPYVRRYQEETRPTVWLFVDASPSMQGAEKAFSNAVYACELASTLAENLLNQCAQVGLLVFTHPGTPDVLIQPATGAGQRARIQHALRAVVRSASVAALPAPAFFDAAAYWLELTKRWVAILKATPGARVLLLTDGMHWPDLAFEVLSSVSPPGRGIDWLWLLLQAPVAAGWGAADFKNQPKKIGLPLQDPEQGTLVWVEGTAEQVLAHMQAEVQDRQARWAVLLSRLGAASLLMPVGANRSPIGVVAGVMQCLGLQRRAG
ncbi:MAG: DUF58 domain-containing protein [Candidatus Melainabacteria bacterium]|nr:DUF58 domain-containing protein [Candidatus Melainabacteria bacterium]